MINAITPYLNFNDQCEKALNFYAGALGGKITMLQRVSDSPAEYQEKGMENLVMHGELRIGEMTLMASDTMGRKVIEGDNQWLTLNFTDEKEQANAWKAFEEGATVIMPLNLTFWGAKFGMLRDRFGINWMFNWSQPGGNKS